MSLYKSNLPYDAHTLSLCHTTALNAWDKTEEVGKKTEPLSKVIQGPTKTFPDFLQRLNSAVIEWLQIYYLNE